MPSMSREPAPSPLSSNSEPRRRRKGQTCLNCRRRKIRCDGVRPVCGLCVSGSTSFEDCEYPGTDPTMTQLLEQKISQVQSRIRVLEEPEDTTDLALHHPYTSDTSSSPDLSTGKKRRNFQSCTALRTEIQASDKPILQLCPQQGSLHYEPGSVESFQEPLPNRRRELLDTFFKYGDQFGFFLDIDRVCQAIMLPNQFGDSSRPSPALLSAVYLWASHLSTSQGPFEKTLLANTLNHLAQDLSSAHPHRVVHSIQAEVLVSYYYLKNGKMLEGNHHADVALSLAIAANLDRIRSSDVLHTSNYILQPPMDPIEEGERINAFWAVLVLNNHWAAIQKSHSAYIGLQNGTIDTPWPMDTIELEYLMLPVVSRATLQNFLEGRNPYGFSENALHAKASILFERANSIHNADKRHILQSGVSNPLDSLIDNVQSNLLFYTTNASERTRYKRITTQMLLYAATIKLHRPFLHEFENSYHKTLFAAKAIAQVSTNIGVNDPHINPMIGVIWSLACETLMPLASIPGNNELASSLLSYMHQFSGHNPLFKFLSFRFQAYTSGNSR